MKNINYLHFQKPIIGDFFIKMSKNTVLSFSQALFSAHDTFKEIALTHRRFKHKDLVPLISKHSFEYEIVGYSFEERAIYQIKLGTGATNVLLWSQMHGDEATATMAIMDIFNFFEAKNDEFDELRKTILQNCTLYFVPMLNPDGAERFQRRTASEIDMNRDALRLESTEAKLLKRLQDELKPDFSFNLHDQGTRYSAGKSDKQATISFLATSYNFAQDWNETRTRAMQVICGMNEEIQKFIPNHVGKWNDEHEPRAFGDNVAKWGSSLILIESGGYKADREKQFIRKLNFVALLSGLFLVAKKSYLYYKLEDYEAIPNNEKYLFDLLIRNASFLYNNKTVIKDIGINLIEKNTESATDFVLSSVIEDLGDLSTFWGIKEIDATDLEVYSLSDFDEIKHQYKHLEQPILEQKVLLDESAYFVLAANQEVKYIIINGQIQAQ